MSVLAAVVVTGLVAPAQGQSGCAAPGAATITGSFAAELEGDWVLVPFDVPSGCDELRVTLTHEQTPAPGTPAPGVPVRHTIDLAIYEPTADGFWDGDEFRGYGGSGETDVVIDRTADTTRGFMPGPVPAGRWAAELGLASLASVAEGDADGRVAWELEVSWSRAGGSPAWSPRPYPEGPARGEARWYAGDFHVHGPHSNDGLEMTWDDLYDVAFAETGLDFIAVSDHNVTRPWHEIGATDVPDGKLVLRSNEVTTYLGHVNAHAAPEWVDYRTGTVWERQETGDLVELRDPVAPGDPGGIFDQIHAAGGWTQVNHPTTFPSPVPGVGNLCRGCPWEYSDAETDWSKVDAMEIATGPAGTGEDTAPLPLPPELEPGDGTLGPNPFTPLAIEWFDRLQRQGHDITAVGSSDSHDLDHDELTKAPIGEATTMIYAEELSEEGLQDAIEAGHAYVKLFGPDAPDVTLEARPVDDPGAEPAMMGDELTAMTAMFTATVAGTAPRPGPLTLHVFVDGVPTLAFPVPNDAPDDVFSVEFPAAGPGDYRLQLMRGSAIEVVTNPINLRLRPSLP